MSRGVQSDEDHLWQRTLIHQKWAIKYYFIYFEKQMDNVRVYAGSNKNIRTTSKCIQHHRNIKHNSTQLTKL